MSELTYRILLVDDDQEFVQNLQNLLENFTHPDPIKQDIKYYFDVFSRSTVHDAMTLIEHDVFDVIVVDEVLNDNEQNRRRNDRGTILLQQLYEMNIDRFPSRLRPGTLMLTGRAPEQIDDASELGISSFITKPIDTHKLVEYIEYAAKDGKEKSIEERIRLRFPELIKTKNLYKTACEIAVQEFDVHTSGIVEFPSELSEGYVAMRIPVGRFEENKREVIPVKGIRAEEMLVRDQKVINFSDLFSPRAQEELGIVAEYLIERDGTRSILVVPIIAENKVVASISIDSRTVKEFSKRHVQALTALADQLGTVWYYRRITDRLNELSKAWTELFRYDPHSVYELLDKLLDIATRVMGITQTGGAGIYIYEQSQQRLFLYKDTSSTRTNTKIELLIGQGAAGRLIELKGKSNDTGVLHIPNYREWSRRAQVYEAEKPFGSILATRLEADDEIFGVIYVYERELCVFVEPEIQIFVKLAQQAMMAIQLRQEKDWQRKQTEILREVANTMQEDEAVTSQDVLHAILTGVTSQWGLEFNRAILLLIDHHDIRKQQKNEQPKRVLVGREGIGFLTRKATHENIEEQLNIFPKSFSDYWNDRRKNPNGKQFKTPLSEQSKKIHIVLDNGSFLDQIISQSEPRILVSNSEKDMLPKSLRNNFKPTKSSDVVIIPVFNEGSQQPVGIIVADNIENQKPISFRKAVSAQNFVNYCIIVYRNVRRRALAEEIEKLNRHANINTIWQAVAEATCAYLSCDIASLYAYNSVLEQLEDPPTIISNVGKKIIPTINRYRKLINEESLPDALFEKLVNYHEPVFVTNIKKENQLLHLKHSSFRQQHEIQSLAVTILWVDDNPIGLMFLNYKEIQLFTESVKDDIRHFTNQVSFILRSKVQYQDLFSESERLRRLFDTSRALINFQHADASVVLKRVAENALEQANADIVSVFVINGDNEIIADFHETSSISDKNPQPITSINEGRLNTRIRETGHRLYVIEYSIPVSFQNIHLLPRNNDNQLIDPKLNIVVNPIIPELGYSAFICLPMRLSNDKKPIGVLWVGYFDPQRFTNSLTNDLQIYADFAASAYIANEDADKRLTALNTLINTMTNHKQQQPINGLIADVLESSLQLIKDRNILNKEGFVELFGIVVADKVVFPNPPNSVDNIKCIGKLNLPKENGNPYINLKNRSENPNNRLGIIGMAAKTHASASSTMYPDELIPFKSDKPSQIAIPVFSENHVYGVLSIEHPLPNVLDKEDQRALEALARYLGVVLDSAIDSQRFALVLEAAKDMLNSQERRTEEEIFILVAEHTLAIMSIKPDLKLSFCHVVKRNANNINQLKLIAHFPKDGGYHERHSKLVHSYEQEIDLSEGKNNGIIGKLMNESSRENPSLYVEEVTKGDSDYITIVDSTLSQLSTAIFVRGTDKSYGGINIEHPSQNAFDEQDIKAIEMLAEIAGLALSNLFVSESNEVLAWSGATRGIMKNRTDKYLFDLQRNLEQAKVIIDDLRDQIDKGFGFHTQATVVEDAPLIEIEPCLSDYMRRWVVNLEDFSIDYQPSENLKNEYMRLNIEFLTKVIDILIDNAIGAKATKIIVLAHISLKQDGVKILELSVSDNDSGIPSNLLPTFFIRPYRQDRSIGLGGISARAIIDSLNGSIFIRETNSSGTTVVIQLPIFI